MCFLIHGMYASIFVNTAGYLTPHLFEPNERAPRRYIGLSSAARTIRGPPLSPWHVSFPEIKIEEVKEKSYKITVLYLNTSIKMYINVLSIPNLPPAQTCLLLVSVAYGF